jgi:CDP-diacylglycerol---glycerol-3-phosphate 3-phosphatidyltransferase
MARSIARDLRTTPNIITLSRIVLLWLAALFFFYVSRGTGIVLAITAGVTDYLDGYIARRTGQVTRLGEILDQFCDLCFESFLILIATASGFFPPYVLCLYLFREFWVLCIRRFMAAAGMNIPSSLLGKVKTNVLMWSFLPTYLSISGFAPSLEPYIRYFGQAAIGLGLVASYVSAWGYTRAFAAGYAEATSKLD